MKHIGPDLNRDGKVDDGEALFGYLTYHGEDASGPEQPPPPPSPGPPMPVRRPRAPVRPAQQEQGGRYLGLASLLGLAVLILGIVLCVQTLAGTAAPEWLALWAGLAAAEFMLGAVGGGKTMELALTMILPPLLGMLLAFLAGK